MFYSKKFLGLVHIVNDKNLFFSSYKFVICTLRYKWSCQYLLYQYHHFLWNNKVLYMFITSLATKIVNWIIVNTYRLKNKAVLIKVALSKKTDVKRVYHNIINSVLIYVNLCLAQIQFVINIPKQVMKPKGYIATLITLILIIRSWRERDLF